MQVTLMHNPSAGSGKPSAEELLEALTKAGFESRYQSTKEDNYEEALNDATDMVLVAGGDGTIGKIAKKLVGRNIPLTFLPIGTANNIAKTFNLIGSPIDLIHQIKSFKKTKFNVGNVKGPWGEKQFIEAVGFGIFPKMMQDYRKLKNDGLSKDDEVKQALKFLKNVVVGAPACYCKIIVDGEEFNGDYILVEVMNIKTMGPNIPLAAEANPCDNLFDIVMITYEERKAFEEYLDGYIKGKTSALDLTIRKGAHIKFFGENFTFHIDDDIWPEDSEQNKRYSESVEITMAPDSLELYVPVH